MIHNAASSGYQNTAEIYSAVRPSYHPNLLERFQSHVLHNKVVELGAGTGIFTQQLVNAGYTPIALEPVTEMRARLANKLPNIEVLEGTAEQTGLKSNSVHTVVAAQAFHWFNYSAALEEIRRILVPGGLLICVWNTRDTNVAWVNSYECILDKYAGSTPRHRTMEWRKAIDSSPFFKLIDEYATLNPRASSPDLVVNRALSTSFIGALDSRIQQGVINEIQHLVAELGENFDFPYISEIQVWKKIT